MKTIIISQPKSGTYLCSNLLVELGLSSVGLHLTDSKYYYQYDLNSQDCMNEDIFRNYKHTGKSLIDNLSLILPNHFAVGHIPFRQEYVKSFEKYKLIYLHREAKDIESSWGRFNQERGRYGRYTEASFNKIAMWKHHAHNISFNDMVSTNTVAIDALQLYLFNEIVCDSLVVMQKALAKPSLTKSSIRI